MRYAVRQVLDQEYRKETIRKQSDALSVSNPSAKGLARNSGDGGSDAAQKSMKEAAVKRDFFGRVIHQPTPQNDSESKPSDEKSKAGRKVWVTFHEGFSNAVRKPVSLGELLAGL